MAKTDLLRGVLRSLRLSRGAILAAKTESRVLEEELSTRREFLRRAAAAGALAFGGGLLERAAAAPPQPAEGEPVVILGAGLAGLTAAYRLQQARVPWALYEAGPRWGGRVLTRRGFNADGMFCELGGELVDTSHEDLLALARELGLGVEPLAPAAVGVTRNLYHFGGRAYSDAELLVGVRPLVGRVLADLRTIFGAAPRRMITYDAPANAARWDKMTLREYLDSMTGVDRWVRDAIEVAYVTEYGLDAERQSALNLLMLVSLEVGPGDFELFGVSDEAFRIVGGSGALPDALAARLGLAADGGPRYKPGHELIALSDRGRDLTLTFAAPQGTVEVRAARAICTIPFSVLRGVDGVESLSMRPQKKAAIREMGYGTNSKLMLGFRDRAWRSGLGGSLKSNGGVFCDLDSQSFWETSRLQKGERGIITNYTGGAAGLACTAAEGPALADLDALFPGLKARFDGSKAFMNWGRQPHALGSYVCAQPGDYTRHFGSAGLTECGGRLLFAGEHASIDNGGYMNGGVETGNLAARALIAGRR